MELKFPVYDISLDEMREMNKLDFEIFKITQKTFGDIRKIQGQAQRKIFELQIDECERTGKCSDAHVRWLEEKASELRKQFGV